MYTRHVRTNKGSATRLQANTLERQEQRTAQKEMPQQYKLRSNTSARRVQEQARRERVKMSI